MSESSDRITLADVEALVDNQPESLFLTAELRAEMRSYGWWRRRRRRLAGSRPPDTRGEEAGE